MATSPTLVVGTSPQTITDGGGAAAVTVDVFNAMWDNAMKKAQAAIANANAAMALVANAPLAERADLDTAYLIPDPPNLPDDDPNNGEAIYQAQRDFLLNLVPSTIANYLITYFPDTSFYEDALEWCHNAFTAGGTGINPGVEQALQQRARARVMADSERLERETETLFANRGWPMPPGALMGQLQEVRLDAGRKLAEASRDVMIKSWDSELENVRFALKQVIDQKQIALQSAQEYLKSLLMAPQIAADLAGKLVNIRSDYARNLVQLYSARTAALEPKVRLAIADADLQTRANLADQQSRLTTADAQMKVALSAMQVLASQTSAGLNAIGARAGISGSDSSNV